MTDKAPNLNDRVSKDKRIALVQHAAYELVLLAKKLGCTVVVDVTPSTATNSVRDLSDSLLETRKAKADKPVCNPEHDITNVLAYQCDVADWMNEVFGPPVDDIANGHFPKIRFWRFLEEAIETAQAGGVTKPDVLNLVDYTFGRPVGVVRQEIGGVMLTLAALCNSQKVSMGQAAREELERVSTPEMMDKIRRKQATKPKFSSLPEGVEHQWLDNREAHPNDYTD